MQLLARWWRGIVGHRWAADAALGWTVIAVTLLTTVAAPHAQPLTWPAVLTAVLTGGALVHRRIQPFAVLGWTAVGAEAYLVQFHDHQGFVVLVAPLIALYTVADLSPRRRALLISVAVVLVFGVAHVLLKRQSWLGTDNLALAALGGLAIAAGLASRNRRAYLTEAQARAAHAEADREAEASRRVTGERLRIARDLHDAVGHQLALISVQARVAGHLLERRPEQARTALAHVHAAAGTALGELSDTIGLLRQPGDALPTGPTPGLAALDDLVTGFRDGGLRVTLRLDPPPGSLPPAVERTAYRVVQEALTNVCKHAGPTRAAVTLAATSQTLTVTVDNDPGWAGPDTGAGHGVIGMRERVSAVGGTLTAGPRPDGGYAVRACLPLAGAR
jgi:signal transduction histidine kinase